MRGIAEFWLSQLHKLLVLWPAWLLTPEGLRTAHAPRMLWKIALMVALAVAISSLLQAGLPPDLAVIGSGDLVAYLDVVAIAWAVGAVGALNSAARWAIRRRRPGHQAQVAARRGRRTAVRRRGRKRLSPPANDDGFPGHRWTDAA